MGSYVCRYEEDQVCIVDGAVILFMEVQNFCIDS